jgi:hypothetical protein
MNINFGSNDFKFNENHEILLDHGTKALVLKNLGEITLTSIELSPYLQCTLMF